MRPDFRARSTQAEWMDTEQVTPEDFAACLADLAVVNTLTLARAPTVAFMRRVARGLAPGARLRVLDVGYGEGDMLRRLHRWGARRGLRLELSGIDLNPWSAVAAQAATPPDMAIDYRTGDLFDLEPGGYDVVLSSLFTHHLDDGQVVQFLHWMERSAARGWFVNDLHRHWLAYYGFSALSTAAGWHRFVRHDGPLSVARSFRRAEWHALLRQARLDGVATLRWRLPFRFCVGRVR